MPNPWTKKNPFMSMWLSGSAANRARGRAMAAAKRWGTALAKETAKAWTRDIPDAHTEPLAEGA